MQGRRSFFDGEENERKKPLKVVEFKNPKEATPGSAESKRFQLSERFRQRVDKKDKEATTHMSSLKVRQTFFSRLSEGGWRSVLVNTKNRESSAKQECYTEEKIRKEILTG